MCEILTFIYLTCNSLPQHFAALPLDINATDEEMFIEHMKTYELNFKTGKEFVQRLEVFIKAVEEVTAWNKDEKNTFKKGLNQFSHMTGTCAGGCKVLAFPASSIPH